MRKEKDSLASQTSLDQRISILQRSVKEDSQALYCSHLAKSLAMRGDLEPAKFQMANWGRLVGKSQRGKEEAKRWKKACLALHLHLARRKNPQATLTDAEKDSAKKFRVDIQEVENTCSLAMERGYLWLFDQVDQDLVELDKAWKPLSKDQYGAWQ